MEKILDQLYQSVGGYVPNLLGALAILIIGWLIALIVSAIVKGIVKRTSLDNKLAKWVVGEEKAKKMQVEKIIAKGVFWIIMIFVLVAFFQALKLTIITEPLNGLLNQLLEFLPQLFGAAILILIAWLLATALRMILYRVLESTSLDEKFGSKSEDKEGVKIPLSKSISEVVYWLVFLLFLPAILNALSLQGILEPVQNMLNKILGFLPNILTAAIILLVGWFVAKIVRQIVTNLLAAIGVDRLSEKVGLESALGSQKLSGLIGMILYILILIPIIVGALNALSLDAITQPASHMLNMILESIPAIFAAALILGLSFIIAKVLAGLVENLLSGVGFNNLFVKLGLSKSTVESAYSPSKLVGVIIIIAIMLFAFTEAFNQLGFESLAELVAQFTVLGGRILLGLIIFGIGVFFANLAGNAIKSSKIAQAGLFSIIARIAILILAGAMALRHMGLADEIVNLAFGLLLGAVAVAVAIAFGIGGRELASKKLSEWNQSIAKNSQSN